MYSGTLSTLWIILVADISQCQIFVRNPGSAAYDPLSTNSLRFNFNAFSIAFAGMSMCFDVIVLCFPLPVIHRLMMSTRRKLEVAGIFCLGIL
jgi:hypothetical protein